MLAFSTTSSSTTGDPAEDYRQSHLQRGGTYDANLAKYPFDAYMAETERAYLVDVVGFKCLTFQRRQKFVCIGRDLEQCQRGTDFVECALREICAWNLLQPFNAPMMRAVERRLR